MLQIFAPKKGTKPADANIGGVELKDGRLLSSRNRQLAAAHLLLKNLGGRLSPPTPHQ